MAYSVKVVVVVVTTTTTTTTNFPTIIPPLMHALEHLLTAEGINKALKAF
jgi:hypothetical protein